jgi:leucyl-tRNA---protein transferase
MGQSVFTTNFLSFNSQFYSALWLRIDLTQYEEQHKKQKLKKLNRHFNVSIKQAAIDHEKEDLYQRYKTAITFQASPSLEHLLHSRASANIFNTLEINIRDGEKLIGCGYFDLGKTSAAGISSFYDPEYRKFSLGKYLIYSKIEYCKNLGFRFFYPGYFVPGYKLFDYKLDIGRSALYFYDISANDWKSIDDYHPDVIPLDRMTYRLRVLASLLIKQGIDCRVLRYEYFDVNIISELKGIELFDYPVFLYIRQPAEDFVNELTVYDVRKNQFHFLRCRSVWVPDLTKENSEVYTASLLQQEEILFSTSHESELLDYLTGYWFRIGKTV